MKQPSSTSDTLLGSLFTSADVECELSDAALLRAMLDVEAALAAAEADAGIVPAAAARAIGEACAQSAFDIARLGTDAQVAGNPVVPLVRALGAAVPEAARPWVHHGATSQDILDTALMLLARRSGTLLLRDVSAAAQVCADLASRHRDTVMVARTLGQQAALTTFGLKAAGWLTALDESEARLREVLEHRIAVQLGGAAGTLGVLGVTGPSVLGRLAELLGLAEPVVPWHTDRQRLLELAAALGAVVAAAGKIALDVELLAQTEIGEVSEGTISPDGEQRGGSSALPHKHNPVDAVLIRSAAYRAPGLVATLYAAAQHEHERAAGAWHAEWQPLRELLGIAGGALSRIGALLAGLEVHADRMRSDVDATGGLLMAENLAARLAVPLGRTQAQALVAACCARAVDSGRSLREVALADIEVSRQLSADDVERLFDAAAVLGATGLLIDRALAAHDRRP